MVEKSKSLVLGWVYSWFSKDRLKGFAHEHYFLIFKTQYLNFLEIQEYSNKNHGNAIFSFLYRKDSRLKQKLSSNQLEDM